MSTPDWITTTEPQCVTVRNAVATRFELVPRDGGPPMPLPRAFKTFTRGCLYDADGARIELSVRQGGSRGDQAMSIDPETLSSEQREEGGRLTGRTLYLGPFMNHYGHFITETLSRCWWREAAVAFDHIVAYPFFHNHGRVLPRDYHRYLAGLLGLPIDRIQIITEPTRFDEVVVPEQLWTLNVNVNAHMREIYGRISAQHAAKPVGRIFLSRLGKGESRLSNALAVEEVFAGYGFDIVYPEQMPIAEQLALYANCEIMGGIAGSGMHNCLFARPGLMTIEVGDTRSRHRPVTNQRIANQLAQVDARFIPFGDGERRDIEPRVVRRALRDFLGERVRSGPVISLRLHRTAKKLSARFKTWRKGVKRARG